MKFIIETDGVDTSELPAIIAAIETYMTWDNYKDTTRSQCASMGAIVRHFPGKSLAISLSTTKKRTIKVFAYYQA